ncbi:MBL fold metallo-hydrolase [Pelagibacterium luteolum]|uniref:L-ascorbate metabolism protein UlaG, beta-lactamase superfamily n=1 Tax=Pelagibacterium luteolum TaxID=440168 RepID=A0A1G7S8K7_9HYPH|nr:MBL fold metallo-hydrolase [Pelagibacterium luteolum]SDG19338.1 L-ascorbate metabolism protein UlaG, beta-lactamase superfamily [Pelagibacterium luteolum]
MTDRDTYETAKGPLEIAPIHHASFAVQWNDKTILVDPVGSLERYKEFGQPDLIVFTHHHGDHFDLETLNGVIAPDTRILAPDVVAEQLPEALAERTQIMANGDSGDVLGIPVHAIAMYNTTPDRQKYHEKGVGNGYLFDFAGTTLYLASDTEPTPEMDDLGPIDIAFFPMNLPYTMTPDQVVTCIEKTTPKFAYPFHYRFPFDEKGTEPEALIAIMPGNSATKIVARDWYRDI